MAWVLSGLTGSRKTVETWVETPVTVSPARRACGCQEKADREKIVLWEHIKECSQELEARDNMMRAATVVVSELQAAKAELQRELDDREVQIAALHLLAQQSSAVRPHGTPLRTPPRRPSASDGADHDETQPGATTAAATATVTTTTDVEDAACGNTDTAAEARGGSAVRPNADSTVRPSSPSPSCSAGSVRQLFPTQTPACSLAATPRDVDPEAERAQAEADAARSEAEELRRQMEQLQADLAELQEQSLAQCEEMEASAQQLASTSRQLVSSQQLLSEVQEQLQATQEAYSAAAQQCAAQLDAQRATHLRERQGLQSRLQALTAEVACLRGQLESAQRAADAAVSDAASCRADLAIQARKYESLMAQKLEAEEQRDRLLDPELELALVRGAMPVVEAAMASLEARLDGALHDLAACRQEAVDAARAHEAQRAKWRAWLDGLQAKLADREVELAEAQAQLAALRAAATPPAGVEGESAAARGGARAMVGMEVLVLGGWPCVKEEEVASLCDESLATRSVDSSSAAGGSSSSGSMGGSSSVGGGGSMGGSEGLGASGCTKGSGGGGCLSGAESKSSSIGGGVDVDA